MYLNKKNTNSIKIFIGLIIYRILTDICYFTDIAITYSYYGFKDNRNVYNFILSWVIMIIFSFPTIKLINIKNKTFSNIIAFILILISITPFTTLIYSGTLSYSFIIKNVIYWTVFLTVYLALSKKNTKSLYLKINNKNIDSKLAIFFSIFSVALVLYISYKYTGFRLNFNMFNVYKLRAETISYNFPTIIQYLFAWTRTINIILMAYCLTNKKYYMASILFITQMFSFGIDGLKSTFFLAILVVVFTLFYDNNKINNFKETCVYGICGLSFLGIIEKIFLKTSNIITLLIRRVLIFPIYLNSCYVDFFDKNPPDYFKASFLRFFGFTTSYPKLDHIIGTVYFNKPAMGCNNGLIAEAVSNFGTPGIFIMPIILVIILILMDKCAKGLDLKVYLIIAFYFAITISNTFITTALLTHGFLIANIIFLTLKKQRENNTQKETIKK